MERASYLLSLLGIHKSTEQASSDTHTNTQTHRHTLFQTYRKNTLLMQTGMKVHVSKSDVNIRVKHDLCPETVLAAKVQQCDKGGNRLYRRCSI